MLIFNNAVLSMDKDYFIKPKILKVYDGDTIQIKAKESDLSIRLYGIDCYETSIPIY